MSLSLQEELQSILKPEIVALLDQGYDEEEIFEELEEVLLLLKEEFNC